MIFKIEKRVVGLCFLAVLMFLGMAQSLDAQSNVTRRIVWSGGEHALRYAVEIQRSESGTFLNFLREFSNELFIEVSLPPGEYRFRIIPHDILDRPGESTEWMPFVIQAPAQGVTDSFAVISTEDYQEPAVVEAAPEPPKPATAPVEPSDPKSAAARNNWLSFDFGLVGEQLRYERMLGPKTSLGFNAFFGLRLFEDMAFGFDALYYYYPFGGTFYLGAGLGYYNFEINRGNDYDYESRYYNVYGLALVSELGWKFDFGKTGGWFSRLGYKGVYILGKHIGEGFNFFLFTGIGFAWGMPKNEQPAAQTGGSASTGATRFSNIRDNWFSVEVAPGYNIYHGFGTSIGARYERMLGNMVSLGATYYYFIPSDTNYQLDFEDSLINFKPGVIDGIDGFIRIYPTRKAFFYGLAVGYHSGGNIIRDSWGRIDEREFSSYNGSGLAITGELGWKIDIGKEGGFFIQHGFLGTFIAGERGTDKDNKSTKPENDDDDYYSREFLSGYWRYYFGVGYAW
jgi:hypothetical protein